MRRAVSKALAGGSRLLHERTILVLTLMFCAGVAVMLWQVSRLQTNLIASIALQDASLYAQAVAEFRTLYTSEVVEAVRGHGIAVTHDYATKAGAIPLPATLSMLLGKHIGAHESGAQTRLYSAYPFPWRQQEGGLQDAFGQEAWKALQQHAAAPFYRFEEVQGRRSLRYATADRMRPSCINCHNTHPASPKTDWQTGDVRGVLEVVLPLDAAIARTRRGLQGTLALMTVMSMLGLSGLALVISRLRRSATDLAQRARTLQNEIIERQRVEDALRESEAQYRTLVEGSIQGIAVFDQHGTRVFANAAYASIFGYEDSQELIGESVIECIAPHDRERLYRDSVARYRGEAAPIHIEYQGVRKDATLIWLESMVSCVSWAGAPAQLATMIDITERKRAEQERLRLEQQMQQAQKLESLGVLAGGIAHDFNNLLTGILTNAGMARQALAPHHPATSYVGEAIQGARLASHLTGQLLAYAGKGRFHIRPLDLSAEVRELEPLLTTAIRGQGRLVLELAPHLPSIEADPAQLHQVLMNLVLNAAECVAEEVTIRITTDSRALVSDDLGQLVPGHHLSVGDCVVLQVQDTGCGMDEATVQRIFDPFFTSKATGRGLGLAATLGIVHGHGGGLRLTSRVGRGTTFELYFPASDKPVDQVAEDNPRDLSGQGVILVVDDDVFVLKAASAALQRLGYRVLLAEDGERALAVFQERLQEIDLIVLDRTMPGLSGEETFRRLRALHPEVKVLLSSAYDEAEVAGQVATTSVVGFLHKPYGPEQLGTQVKQLLEGADASVPVMTTPDADLVAVQASFRQRLPARLDALAVGLREAQATSGSDEALQATHRIAHTLKGTVGSYGFDNLATVLEDIETTLKEGRDGKRRWTEMDWSQMLDIVDQARASLTRETPSD
jgi:PAS domain S-box-containing protein